MAKKKKQENSASTTMLENIHAWVSGIEFYEQKNINSKFESSEALKPTIKRLNSSQRTC